MPQAKGPPQIPLAIEIRLRNAPTKTYQQVLMTLLGAAQNEMIRHGFDFGTSGIVADWAPARRKRTGLVAIKFPSVETARAFHYKYKDFEWESEGGTQTIIIELQHVVFDVEMQNPRVRLAVSSVQSLTPDMVKSIVGGISD